MMSTGRAWLRRLTTILLLLTMAAATAIVVHKARTRQKPQIAVSPPQIEGKGSGEVNNVYEDFKVSERVAGRLIFDLSSIRSLGLSSGWQEIEGVRLQLFNEDESSAVVNCDTASFNIKTRDARLRGGVHVEFPNGGFLRTEKGRFDAAGRRFITEAKTVFAGGNAIGQAGKAIYSVRNNRLILEHQVIIRMPEGQTLYTPKLIYDRGRSRIIFPDGCRIEYPMAQLEAPVVSIQLDEIDGPPSRIQLTGGVSFSGRGLGVALSGGEPSAVSEVVGWSETLVAERDAGNKWQVTAATTGPWVDLLVLSGPGFLARSLKTWRLQAVVAQEGVINMRASQVVCMKDIPLGGSARWAEAGDARIWFRDGEASDMELEGEVVLRSDAGIGSGARARMTAATGTVMLYGDASGRRRATLLSGRGQVTSDQVQLVEARGHAEARGNVQGRLEDVALLGQEPGVKESGPLHFAGASLDASDKGQSYHLKGNARAWQGQRFIFADELVLKQKDQSLDALGHVRTTMPASQVEAGSSKDAEVLVVARSLHYSRTGQQAVFRGSVRFTDEQHMLSTDELLVLFNAEGAVETIEANGSVDILELATGRRMKGQHARRDCLEKLVHVTGKPVQVIDEKGNLNSGTSLTWDQASGRVSLAGSPDSQTETIIVPEEP
jgi:lipopolysaccharide export system protein LptA